MREINRTRNQRCVRVVLVDDHSLLRDLTARTLAQQKAHYTVLAAVGTAAEAIAACRNFQPDLLILDINLPDQNGIDALPELRRVSPKTRILMCTGFPTDDRIADLASAGAHGFVQKMNTWDDFLYAVERVSHGEYYFRCESISIAPEIHPLPQRGPMAVAAYLTPREKEILTLIAQGFMNKEIAAKLYISIGTVETHRSNLMGKLGVRNVAGLVTYAIRKGFVKHVSNKLSHSATKRTSSRVNSAARTGNSFQSLPSRAA